MLCIITVRFFLFLRYAYQKITNTIAHKIAHTLKTVNNSKTYSMYCVYKRIQYTIHIQCDDFGEYINVYSIYYIQINVRAQISRFPIALSSSIQCSCHTAGRVLSFVIAFRGAQQSKGKNYTQFNLIYRLRERAKKKSNKKRFFFCSSEIRKKKE